MAACTSLEMYKTEPVSAAGHVMLAEDDAAPCGCRPVLTGYGLAHAKPLDVAESPNIVRGAEIAHWSPERLIDADNTKVPLTCMHVRCTLGC